MVYFFFDKLENIVEKGENAGYQHFLISPRGFSKKNFLFRGSSGVAESRHCEVKTNPFPKQALVLTCLQYKSFENTVGKGEIARYEQFLLFPRCFQPVWRTFYQFQQT